MPGPRVALFVTCLVDMFRPSIGFATVKLLRDAGCAVEVPEAQTCCGQPAWNTGDKETAKAVARQVIAAFEGYDYVVAPSGSCAATIAKDYPQMLAGDAWEARAKALAGRTFEITAFLADVMGVAGVAQAVRGGGDLSRQLLGAQEPRGAGAAAAAAGQRRGAGAARDGGAGRLLRVRRDVLREVSRDLGRDGRGQDEEHRRDRGPSWCWRAISGA